MTKENHTAFIKVGATFVNSIELTNTTTQWEKGEEVGYFAFGSTVVMLFEQDAIEFMRMLHNGCEDKNGRSVCYYGIMKK